MVNPYLVLLLPLAYLIFYIWQFISKYKLIKDTKGYGIIYGPQGSGKSVLSVQRASYSDKVFSNIPLPHAQDFNLKKYLDSVGKNNSMEAIKGVFHITKKQNQYENVGIVYDDLALYLPNYMDSELKKYYPQIGFMFPIRRQLYNHPYFIMAIQDMDRIYKIAKELQIEYFISAENVDFTFIRFIPIMGYYNKMTYTWYNLKQSAEVRKRPYKDIAILDSALSVAHTGAGRALQKIYNAENGVIKTRSYLFKSNKKTVFDSRYFHQKVFGYKSSEQEPQPKQELEQK